MKISARLASVPVLCAALGTFSLAAIDDTHRVALTIQVLDESGTAIPEFPLLVSLGGEPAKDGIRTDATGQVTTKIRVPDAPSELVVTCMAPEIVNDPYGRTDAAVQSYIQLTTARRVSKWYTVPLQGTESTVSYTITVPKAVTLQGKVLLPPGSTEGVVSRSLGRSICHLKPDGTFKIGGFLRGTASGFFIEADRQPEVVWQSVNPSIQIAADGNVTLPDIQWPIPGGMPSKEVNVTILNGQTLPVLYGDSTHSVSLISTTLDHLYTFEYSRQTGQMLPAASAGGTLPKVVPGTYYLMLGDFMLGPADIGFEALRAGREAELVEAQFPTLVVPVDATTPIILSVDGATLWTKMKSLGP